jgi:hypothetical protein
VPDGSRAWVTDNTQRRVIRPGLILRVAGSSPDNGISPVRVLTTPLHYSTRQPKQILAASQGTSASARSLMACTAARLFHTLSLSAISPSVSKAFLRLLIADP